MTSTDLGRMALATARQQPDLLAIITDSSVVTYAQLARRVGAYMARMQALGIGPGSRVTLDSGDVTVVAPVILGCALPEFRHLPRATCPTGWRRRTG